MLSRDELREIFIYDESVPSCLRWRKSLKPSKNGKMAGSFRNKGKACFIKINGKYYSSQKVVWALHNDTPVGSKDIINIISGYTPKIDLLEKYDAHFIEECNLKSMPYASSFEYLPQGELRWRIPRFSGFKTVINRAGDQLSTCVGAQGYKIASLHGKHIPLHRIIWITLNGDIPSGKEVDHVDGDRLNNTIENLRVVSRAVNCRNISKKTNNTTGYCGVSSSTRGYTATWYDSEGQHKRVLYSFKKYGKDALQLAVRRRQTEIEKLNLQYGENGYTARHGL